MLSSAKALALIRAVNAPIRSLSPLARLGAGVAAIISCLIYTMYGIARSESVYIAGDARFYIAIATGDYSQVMQPFASRQLGALLVTGLMHLLHCTVESGFLLEGAASIVFTLVAIYYLALKTAAPRWFLFAMPVLPFWSFLLQDLVLPDLWYSALLSLLLLLLHEEYLLVAALMMFPLMLSRESTSLTLACFLIAAWKSAALDRQDRCGHFNCCRECGGQASGHARTAQLGTPSGINLYARKSAVEPHEQHLRTRSVEQYKYSVLRRSSMVASVPRWTSACDWYLRDFRSPGGCLSLRQY